MERYGNWNGIPIYKIKKEEYIRLGYYNDVAADAHAYWIINDNNKVVYQNTVQGIVTGDYVRDIGIPKGMIYYREPKIEEATEADRIIGGVYTAKLWEG